MDGCGIIEGTCRSSSECEFSEGAEECVKGCKRKETTGSTLECEYDECRSHVDGCLNDEMCGMIEGECENRDGCAYTAGGEADGCRDGCVHTLLGCVYDVCGGYSSSECIGMSDCEVVDDKCSSIVPPGGCVEVEDVNHCLVLDECEVFAESKCDAYVTFYNTCSVIGKKACSDAFRHCTWDDNSGCDIIKKEDDDRWDQSSKAAFPWWIFVIVGLFVVVCI
jgi:hypothetical protein